VDETASRLVAAADVGVSDVQEKSYAWGDVDHDGDVDLVAARKQPFSTPGKRPNVLLLNENGVLTDRTADLASSSDVVGDQGFLTPTNDRDVVLADVDQDGWLDLVTATAQSGTDPKHIGHPRVYRNLGEGPGGWLGFRHEDARIPVLLVAGGAHGFNPNFAAVAAGDVTGDGYPDLYFSDYDAVGESSSADFNDKLLVNQGPGMPGFFTDATGAFTGLVPLPGPDQPFTVSSFGTSAAIADLNGDGVADVVKQTTLQNPIYVGVAYGDPVDGFATYEVLYQLSPYFLSVGDLNNDDRLDLVVTDDGLDRYLLNQGNGADGLADFLPFVFSYAHDGDGASSYDQGFGGDSRIADLNHDGRADVLVSDVSVDLAGCGRRLSIYRNKGGFPGGAVILEEQTSGELCGVNQGNPPSCIVAGIPASDLEGVHDVAVFDVNGDGWQDLVLGRCSGTAVYVNVPQPPAGSVPDGDGVAGAALSVGKTVDGRVELEWAPSCGSDDIDYEVYEGRLDDFTSHEWKLCSTGGVTSATLDGGEAAYFIVVPRNASREGAYGHDSAGNARPPAAWACLPQLTAGCEP
jgi:hypothetical protein